MDLVAPNPPEPRINLHLQIAVGSSYMEEKITDQKGKQIGSSEYTPLPASHTPYQ